MSILNKQNVEICEYASELLDTPKAHLKLCLLQDETGLKITHNDKLLMIFKLTHDGMLAAGFVAKALGANVPPLGESSWARVSTGVFFRATSIAQLDYSNEASSLLLERWLNEADLQRGNTPK
ncbi:uncharacterized protein METZ01_LOCUS509416 [marine metagenome]|uniref:Uncharacterized protein n=1 Tax=marine metagenome TaxID=408172 RepID=A0A383EI54_9ZZZZ